MKRTAGIPELTSADYRKKAHPRIAVVDMLKALGGEARRRQIFDRLHELNRVHGREVVVHEIDLKGLGLSLRRLRTDAGLSLREVAAKLHVSAPFLSDCELGRRRLGLVETVLFLHYCDKTRS